MNREAILLSALLWIGMVECAVSGGKVGMNIIYMIPYGSAATDFSNPGAGIGLNAVFPLKQTDQICALVTGIEVVNLHTRMLELKDYEQRTTQNYIRFLVGFQIGGYGEDFLRPHGGLNVAIVRYGINTDFIYPDNTQETFSEENKTIIGCDMTFGLDFNIKNMWNLDFGVRYIKSFGLVQQLGVGLVKVHPEYFQAYIGAGISFEYLFTYLN
jgi:hypothetical protein